MVLNIKSYMQKHPYLLLFQAINKRCWLVSLFLVYGHKKAFIGSKNITGSFL